MVYEQMKTPFMDPEGRRNFLKSLGLFVVNAMVPGSASAYASENAYHRIVILGDLHLPGNNIEVKKRVLETVNSWNDVEMVVAVGDICETSGTSEEYVAAKTFFAKLEKPLFAIAGNHDFIYSFHKKGAKSEMANAETREEKLRNFRETFGLKDLYYSKTVGNYFLIFLSTDSPGHLAEISQKQMEWLGSELERNKKQPTIIFFHAPLEGTLRGYNRYANTFDFIAQPSGTIRDLLKTNPHVFLWASGHTHTPPREESFASAINVYDNRISNIHNTDMQNRETVWTNSLFLYPDRVVVKTYNHNKGMWLPEYERKIEPPPQFSAAPAASPA